MNIKEYARKRLEESASNASKYWGRIKSNILSEPLDRTELITVKHIQDVSDDCLDLILTRECKETGLRQMENWRFTVEKRLFKKPKITMDIVSGPLEEEFYCDGAGFKK